MEIKQNYKSFTGASNSDEKNMSFNTVEGENKNKAETTSLTARIRGKNIEGKGGTST